MLRLLFIALFSTCLGISWTQDQIDIIFKDIPYQPAYVKCAFNTYCIPRIQCDNGVIVEDGRFLINIRNGDVNCGYMNVCCSLKDELENPITPAPPTALPPKALPTKPLPLAALAPIDEEYNYCGYANPNGVGVFRFTGDTDNETQFGEFPWMVAILLRIRNERRLAYHCGGAIIASNVIITAAHCLEELQPGNLVVRAGEWDSQHEDEPMKHFDNNVKEIIVHEMYNRTTFYNDIALLITTDKFEFRGNIQPICLPDDQINFNYTTCYATGWGKTTFGQYLNILKKIELPIVSHDKCQRDLRRTRLGRRFKLHDSFICAGGEKDMDTCKGDGGSPLVCPVPNTDNRYYMTGIVSWGKGCGRENVPGVYASIPHLREWINTKLLHKNVDFSQFTVPPYY